MAGNTIEVFDLWQGPDAGLSFATGEGPDATRWRLDLGDEPRGARRRLAALETQIHRAQGRLDAVPGRLDDLLRRALPPDSGVSFSAAAASGPAGELADAERDLLLSTGLMPGEVSFTAGEGPGIDLAGLRAELAGATRRLSRFLTHVAWVETRTGGRLVGQTVVSWTGKTRTVRSTATDREQGALHQRNVAVALASRLGLLRTMVVVAQGAAKVSVLLSAAGGVGAVAALPVAWRFVQQVLAEIETRS